MNFKELIESKKDLFKSRKLKIALIIIGLAILILAVFQLGMLVGFKKASFSYQWGDNYYRAFGKPQGDPRTMGLPNKMGMMEMGFTDAHGVSGRILKVIPPRIMIEGVDNVEKSVLVNDKTVIRRFRDNINISNVQQDEFAVVLGSPNNNGEIEAGFIRIMPPSQPF